MDSMIAPNGGGVTTAGAHSALQVLTIETFQVLSGQLPMETLISNPANGSNCSEEFVQGVALAIEASIAVHERLLGSEATVFLIATVADTILKAMQRGGKLLLFGNGGSAADAQHIAAEFVGRFGFERRALPAFALSVNSSCLTAIGNDYGFDQVFARQIEALARPGDVALGISTTGNSANVLMGLARAKQMGLTTVAMAGDSGGKMKHIVEYCICTPSNETPRIQECHILIGHTIAELVEKAIIHVTSGIS
jgi:D-sedoheptulose 7-phosphate isomerase